MSDKLMTAGEIMHKLGPEFPRSGWVLDEVMGDGEGSATVRVVVTNRFIDAEKEQVTMNRRVCFTLMSPYLARKVVEKAVEQVRARKQARLDEDAEKKRHHEAMLAAEERENRARKIFDSMVRIPWTLYGRSPISVRPHLEGYEVCLSGDETATSVILPLDISGLSGGELLYYCTGRADEQDKLAAEHEKDLSALLGKIEQIHEITEAEVVREVHVRDVVADISREVEREGRINAGRPPDNVYRPRPPYGYPV